LPCVSPSKYKKIKNDSPWQQYTQPTLKILLRTVFLLLIEYGSGKTFTARPVLSNERATLEKNG
jgi:hypothetical protein